MSSATATGDGRSRPWWLLAVAYAVAVVAYVVVTLPTDDASPTAGDASSSRGAPRDKLKLAAVGGIGTDALAERVLEGVGKVRPDYFLPLGDLASGPGSEASWCDLVGRTVGHQVSVQLVAGHHGADTSGDGSMAELARCLRGHKQDQGSYPAQYYFDDGTLLRTVVIAPGLDIAGHQHAYARGSDDERWLRGVLDDARRRKISWIVVAMQKPCISVGRQGCDIGGELLNLLVDHRVDLVLHGHDHTYQRTVQLALSPLCRTVATDAPINRACVSDDGDDRTYRSGDGPVFVVVGTGGGRLDPLDDTDADSPYVAKAMGGNREPTSGFLRLEVGADSLAGSFVKTAGPGDFDDEFEIGR